MCSNNIQDVTNSQEDWEDFWFNEDLGLSYSLTEDDITDANNSLISK